MNLRGIDFGPVWASAGARGFIGEGYAFHKLLGLDWTGTTLVTKTTTYAPRAGHLKLTPELKPKSWFPDCIRVKFYRGAVLNSVGLSGPGAEALLERWISYAEGPFIISFAPGNSLSTVGGLTSFLTLISENLHRFKVPFGIELNFSCPNTEALSDMVALLCLNIFDAATALKHVPVICNFGPKFVFPQAAHFACSIRCACFPPNGCSFEPESLQEVARHRRCDAISVANSWPYREDCHVSRQAWGPSAPKAYPTWGISGAFLYPFSKYLAEHADSFAKPLIVGGGIQSGEEAYALLASGAAAVKLGTIGILRPWRLRETIRTAREFA